MVKAVSFLIVVSIAAYVAAVGYLFLFQRQFVFQPGGVLASPAERGLDADVEAFVMEASDGTALTGWRRAADPGRPTVLYFQGNAGNISDRAAHFRTIIASGFGLMAMSYRGYAGSGGSPGETALFSDALEIFDRLAATTGDIVIHGESLGTAPATYVAAERTARALVLEAPFTAALDIASATYPWVPVRLLMRDPFLSREHIRRVDEPVLIMHGTDDDVIPVEHAKRLYALAREPKRLVIVEGASHNDLWDRGLWPAVLTFLEENGVAAAQP
jgi:fermentation-respiration switch protein FrsA (DUF1100 family)